MRRWQVRGPPKEVPRHERTIPAAAGNDQLIILFGSLKIQVFGSSGHANTPPPPHHHPPTGARAVPAAAVQARSFKLGFLLGGAVMLLLATVGTAGYAAGQATASATYSQAPTVDFTPSTTVVSTDGIAGMTTYQLSAELTDAQVPRRLPPRTDVFPAVRPLSAWRAGEQANIYAIYGDAVNVMTLPAAFQFPAPFGCNVGGSNPAFFVIKPDAAFDSWLSVGPTDGSAGVAISREQQIGGSGGSLEPPGPLREPRGPLLTHLHAVYAASSECLPTRLNPLAERACFSQAISSIGIPFGTWDKDHGLKVG
jgi:hypothetical protein